MKQKKSLADNSAKKRRILIGCAIGGTALIMAGAGIGVGYILWYRKTKAYDSINDVIVTCKVATDKQPYLQNPGDMVHFVFTLEHAMKAKTSIHVQANSTFEPLFYDDTKILEFTDSSGAPFADYHTHERWVDFEAGSITSDIYIKQTNTNTLSDGMTVLPFELQTYYKEETKVDQDDCSVYLYKVADPIENESQVTNLRVTFGTAFSDPSNPNASINFNIVTNYLNSTFSKLPTLPAGSKIEFSSASTYDDVLTALKPYDNAESMAATLISDYVLSIPSTTMTDDWSGVIVNLCNIRVNTIGSLAGGPTTFDMSFFQGGDLVPSERTYTIFMCNNKTFTNDYAITWDSFYDMSSHIQYYNSQGNAVGWLNAKNAASSSREYIGAKQFIKTIYGGLVSTWPTGW